MLDGNVKFRNKIYILGFNRLIMTSTCHVLNVSRPYIDWPSNNIEPYLHPF